jgi:hypothetical protein
MNEQPDILAVQHEEWLQHPVTIALLQIMREHKKHVVSKVSRNAYDESIMPIRTGAITINNIDFIMDYIGNTQKFIEQQNKK